MRYLSVNDGEEWRVRMKALMALAPLALTSCITLPHEPTPGWQCRDASPDRVYDAYANVAADGTLLETYWFWAWRDDDAQWAIRAYAGDGVYRRRVPVPLDGMTTADIQIFGTRGSGQVVLSHHDGENAFADPIAAGKKGETIVRLDWDKLVELARSDAPLYATRKDETGEIFSRAVPKEVVLLGADLLDEARAGLREMVADPANRCIAVDDLYPEIILT